MNRRRLTETLWGVAMVGPTLAVMGVFSLYPAYRIVYSAMHRTAQNQFIESADEFIGMEAFSRAFGSDGEFWSGLAVSTKFMLMTVPAGVLAGLLLAQAADRRIRGIRFFQTVFSSTVATSSAVASVVFFTLLQPASGLLRDVDWLSLERAESAVRAVALSAVWQNAGLTFVIVLAALQTVPDEVKEAALLDGYGSTRKFWQVTVPLISPALLFLAIVLVAHSLQAYAQFEILEPPRDAMPLLYKVADPEGTTDLSTRSAYAVGLFVVTFAVSALQFGVLGRRTHYGN